MRQERSPSIRIGRKGAEYFDQITGIFNVGYREENRESMQRLAMLQFLQGYGAAPVPLSTGRYASGNRGNRCL